MSEIGQSEGAYGTGCKADAAGIQQGDETARRPLPLRGEAVRHFSAFWILYTLRAEERQFTQAEICEFLIEPKQTVHSALKKLEAEGYLARTSGADLRSKRVALTEKGEQFARAWIDRVLEAEAAALCAMPEAERAAFVRGLHSFCRLLEERLRESKAI